MEICYVNQIGDKLLINIFQMFTTVIQALPAGMLVAVITFFIIAVLEKVKGIQIKRSKRRDVIIFAAYLMILFDITIFSRTIGSVNVIDLIPFNTPGGIRYIILYALANAAIFIPFGILAPKIIGVLQSSKKCLCLGFLVSLLIELIQLLLKCGVVQTEDVIMNMFGIEIGYWIYRKWIK
jgi:glycopeptide antibiotics resistance protein